MPSVRRILRYLCASILLSMVFHVAAAGQQSCPLPPPPPADPDILFTDEQEGMLGDVMAQSLARDLRTISDETVRSFIQGVGDRLVQQFPPRKLRFRFELIDLPDANAFALPGGRVMVSRKLIAMLHSEDELAAVLSHELGHIVSRQSAREYSRLFRRAGVTSLKDAADVEDKYHLLLDNEVERDSSPKEEQRHQLQADQLGVVALARAGYDPNAAATFWDRLAETKGKRGSWFTDMFGNPNPNSKRLRELVRTAAAIPAACIQSRAAGESGKFAVWKSAVIAHTPVVGPERLHNVVGRHQLAPPLQSEIVHLKFSPDGKYLLAQDEAGIFVLTREPFAVHFRIDNPDAAFAQFTPDSAAVVFSDSVYRVERWSIAERRREEVYDLRITHGCLKAILSPEGGMLACLQPNRDTWFPFGVTLFDVATGEPVLSKANVFTPVRGLLTRSWAIRLTPQIGKEFWGGVVEMRFSPDGRYFIATRGMNRVGWDLRDRSELRLPGPAWMLTALDFGFVGADRLIGVAGDRGQKSAVVHLPDGKPVYPQLKLGRQKIEGCTRGECVILRPVANHAAGVYDLSTQKLLVATRKKAIDVYDKSYVAERASGEIGLYEFGAQKPVAVLALPDRRLARVRVAVFSPNLRFVALSERDRGAVWDLELKRRLFHIVGFRGGFFSDGRFYVHIPSPERDDEASARKKSGGGGREQVDEEAKEDAAGIFGLHTQAGDISDRPLTGDNVMVRQYGRFVLTLRRLDPKGDKLEMQVEDAISGSSLWTRRHNKEVPAFFGDSRSGLLITITGLRYVGHGDREAPYISFVGGPGKSKKEIEILDLASGKSLGSFSYASTQVVRWITGALPAAGRVALTDNLGRVLIYSLSGELKGRTFGTGPALSPNGKLLAVEREPGHVVVLESDNMRLHDEFFLASPAAAVWFSDDSRRLAVVTEDQTLLVTEAGAPGPNHPATASVAQPANEPARPSKPD